MPYTSRSRRTTCTALTDPYPPPLLCADDAVALAVVASSTANTVPTAAMRLTRGWYDRTETACCSSQMGSSRPQGVVQVGFFGQRPGAQRLGLVSAFDRSSREATAAAQPTG
ncbi:hypothetical protein Vretimale_15414 [Volvox reticuliferus]|uniref:Uncharacterized protein n=1 Tax=Volvox reticuliferus TaxID=1737510 RepID=A0A8J4GQR2_9CHLO|nr:hypothetical protein Vretimale_15414 [Volvox reticuliferus]